MKGISIEQKDKEDLLLGFKSKIELRDNSFHQKILKRYYEKLKEEGAKLKCLCNNVDMSCKYTSYYFLSNLPRNSFKHTPDCIFYEHQEEVTDKDDKYKALIFKEPIIDFRVATNEEKTNHNKINSHRYNTYVNFCTDMISESMSRSFNMKNKNIINRADILYPTFIEFINSFDSLSNKNSLMQRGSIKDSLEPFYHFCYGVIEYDCLSQLQSKQREYDIFLPSIKKQFSDDKKFLGYEPVNINCKINFHTLLSAAELVKNFNNYINPPYFFMAIYKRNKNSKNVVRLFLHPVYFENNHLVFVDSGYERKYAKKLIDEDIPFIKPISDSCFYKLNGNLVNYQKESDNPKRAFLQYLPDFIEFTNDKIDIVEVSGYDNVEYQNLMERKIKHYENESVKSGGLYQVKVVNGKNL